MATEHHQQIGERSWECSVTLYTGDMDAQIVKHFGHVATMVLQTGVCRVQTYATAAQLHDLAITLMAAAGELEAAEIPQPEDTESDFGALEAA